MPAASGPPDAAGEPAAPPREAGGAAPPPRAAAEVAAPPRAGDGEVAPQYAAGEATAPARAARAARGDAAPQRAAAAQEVAPPHAPSRRRNPRGEGGRLREQLLDATVDVLGEVGDADRVSVRAIARRAGVSPTALYLHFPDREALVDAAVDAGFAAFNDELTGAAARPATPHERLEAMGVAYLAFSARRPALYAVLFSARRPMLERPGVPRQRAFDGLSALLREVDATLDQDAARQLALLVWSSLHGYAMLRVARPHFEWPDAETYIRRLLTAHHL